MEGSLQNSQSPAEISNHIASAGHEWADKEAAASLFEETRRSVRAQIAIDNFKDAGSVSKAELIAEASKIYREHIKAMVNARKDANIAKVKYDSGKLWSDLVRTQESTRRAEMNLR